MSFRHSIPINIPPSPIDLSSPPIRKTKKLQINIDDSGHRRSHQPWTPPISPPLSSTLQERVSSCNNGLNSIKRRSRQQQIDIDHLTLDNAKLQRANRMLKVDREKWLEERIRPLEQHIRDLTVSNVRWQRAAKLFQQDLDECHEQLAERKQVDRMGSEYEFLVAITHQLQSQIGITQSVGKPSSVDITKSELFVLLDRIHGLEQELEKTLTQVAERDEALARCRSDLAIKDQVVAQLQLDFETMETQVNSLQYMLEEGKVTASSHPRPTIQTTSEEMTMMLTATSRTRHKRRRPPPSSSRYHLSLSSVISTTTTLVSDDDDDDGDDDDDAIRTILLEGDLSPVNTYLVGNYPVSKPHYYKTPLWSWEQDPFAPFVITPLLLHGLTCLGVPYDWLTPVLLLALVCAYFCT